MVSLIWEIPNTDKSPIQVKNKTGKLGDLSQIWRGSRDGGRRVEGEEQKKDAARRKGRGKGM